MQKGEETKINKYFLFFKKIVGHPEKDISMLIISTQLLVQKKMA